VSRVSAAPESALSALNGTPKEAAQFSKLFSKLDKKPRDQETSCPVTPNPTIFLIELLIALSQPGLD